MFEASIAILALCVFLWFAFPIGKRKRTLRRGGLQQRYLRLLNMPPRAGRETLARTLHDLQERFPARSESWYLRKMISDLERDRR